MRPNHSVKKYPEVSAAAMIEVLAREQHIDSDLEGYLTIVRLARNDWMHHLIVVGRQEAALAKHGAEELL